MLCENCGENEANVRYTQIINGVKKQMILCDKCAKELGLDDIKINMPIDFSSFLGDMLDFYEDEMPTLSMPKTLKCNNCNMTYDDFLETGKFGCDSCYDEFESKIDQLLKNIHGANRHIGRNGRFIGNAKINNAENENLKIEDKQPGKANGEKSEKASEEKSKKSSDKISKIDVLKERLKREIEEERYEDAAKTRDEIKKLEK